MAGLCPERHHRTEEVEFAMACVNSTDGAPASYGMKHRKIIVRQELLPRVAQEITTRPNKRRLYESMRANTDFKDVKNEEGESQEEEERERLCSQALHALAGLWSGQYTRADTNKQESWLRYRLTGESGFSQPGSPGGSRKPGQTKNGRYVRAKAYSRVIGFG
ncbi:hypothetical protein ANN_20561 [Periplaneta americana]|uniref:Uncharacterized protein n=1 Tax=Periplaneta americana TaxID=6978 RepID=A0ABQ8SCX9_PERAM|nr:hypothetical protein ANN_20561 [Periplaneta americana]